MPEDSERAFFPANASQFVERAGSVAKLTEADFNDEHKRRHLESFRESMEAWRGYENKLGKQKEDAVLMALVEDLLQVEHHIQTAADLEKQLKPLRRKYKISPSKQDLGAALKAKLNNGLIPSGSTLESILIKRQVRTASGVAVITVLTSPGRFSCTKDCYYCPNEPGQPRSYLSTEPAVLRANQNGWDPAKQFWDRARTLTKNGHIVDKIELLVLGGTWSGYAHDYQEEFVRDLFYAANVYYEWLEKHGDVEEDTTLSTSYLEGLRERLSLLEEQTLNETAKCKIIGLTLETRPDFINRFELQRLRAYGCTRVQLGIQHTDESILELINRGCTTEDARKAIRLLKDSCFKVDIHLMPDLPGSSVEADMIMFDRILHDPGLQADQWKIYPCEVTPFSRIAQWYEEGRYKPYTETQGEAELLALILKVKRLMHPWIRLNRVVRDIPNPSIIAGNSKTNLRQLLDFAAAKMGWKCACMRCREIRTSYFERSDGALKIRGYDTYGGAEYFISFETPNERTLFGFLRLRLPEGGNDKRFESPFKNLKSKCALIRELHVYGMLVATTEQKGDNDTRYQHSGFGKALVQAAEALSVSKGYEKVAIIAGVGTREYYRKLGYHLDETYMIKSLESDEAKRGVYQQWKESQMLPRTLKIDRIVWDFYPSLSEVQTCCDVIKEVLEPTPMLKSEKRKLVKNQTSASTDAEDSIATNVKAIDRKIRGAYWTEQITRPLLPDLDGNTLVEAEENEQSANAFITKIVRLGHDRRWQVTIGLGAFVIGVWWWRNRCRR